MKNNKINIQKLSDVTLEVPLIDKPKTRKKLTKSSSKNSNVSLNSVVSEVLNVQRPIVYYPDLNQQVISNTDSYVPKIIYDPNLKVQSIMCNPILKISQSVYDPHSSVQKVICSPVSSVPEIIYDTNSNVLANV